MLKLTNIAYHPLGTPQPILRDICLELPPQQLGVIIGTSGAGKSTLLEILSGLAKPTSGQVAWQNQPLSAQNLRRLAGLVFQFPERHFCGFSVGEELRLGHPDLAPDALEQTLAQVGLGAVPWERPPHELSGGQQRRLALAVQLIRSPYLLLLDEPTAGLDWSVQQQVVELLGQLKQSWSILVVSHNLESWRSVADCIWRLERGQLTPFSDAPAE